MTTAVFFHAHPDDEVLFTGGTMVRAAAEGHRVVLVTATRGDRGQDRAGLVGPGEDMGDRREHELRAATALLRVDRTEILGYRDSGIDGDGADGFTQAPTEEVAVRLAGILTAEAADVLVGYDENGIYGHPDHVKVHQVGVRAAELAGTASVFLATVDRDKLQALLAMAETFGLAIDDATLEWAVTAGVAKEHITTTVDVSAYVGIKRDAMAAHRTQFPADSSPLQLPASVFELVFGTEWFIEVGGTELRSWLW